MDFLKISNLQTVEKNKFNEINLKINLDYDIPFIELDSKLQPLISNELKKHSNEHLFIHIQVENIDVDERDYYYLLSLISFYYKRNCKKKRDYYVVPKHLEKILFGSVDSLLTLVNYEIPLKSINVLITGKDGTGFCLVEK